MKVIIDTNVLVVANREAPQASALCVRTYATKLDDIRARGTVVLDDGWRILREYMGHARSRGQPGVGDAFLRWVLTNQANPSRCERVTITPRRVSEADGFAELPDELHCAGLDRSDCKFVAVARAHPEHPPILNAVDSDWWCCQALLAGHGVRVDNLCADTDPRQCS